MKIFVIRHGLTELNKKEILNGRIDEPLAVEGREQARLASLCMPETITHIYVSPLIRAQETAQILNNGRNLPLITQEEIIEVNFGKFTGKSWDSIENGHHYKRKHTNVEYDYRPDGECALDVKQRLLVFLRKIKNRHGDGEILVVTHGGIVRALQAIESGNAMHRIENALFYSIDISGVQ